ncbi:MAG TPA: TRAP transporter small permease subunit [Pseudolabrys sp.]|nr:TRAP transporter small permease subunit [Pseudolabrys sp.]
MPDDLHIPARPAIALHLARIAAFAARALLGTLLVGMVLLNVANAVCRYLFGVVLIGADELLVFAMIWMVMIGMILVTIDRRHIALDFLANRLAPRPRIALTMFHHLIIAIGGTYAAVQCLEFTRRVATIGQTSMAIGFPMLFAHSALVVGFAGTALVAAVLLVSGGTELFTSDRATKTKLP